LITNDNNKPYLCNIDHYNSTGTEDILIISSSFQFFRLILVDIMIMMGKM